MNYRCPACKAELDFLQTCPWCALAAVPVSDADARIATLEKCLFQAQEAAKDLVSKLHKSERDLKSLQARYKIASYGRDEALLRIFSLKKLLVACKSLYRHWRVAEYSLRIVENEIKPAFEAFKATAKADAEQMVAASLHQNEVISALMAERDALIVAARGVLEHFVHCDCGDVMCTGPQKKFEALKALLPENKS